MENKKFGNKKLYLITGAVIILCAIIIAIVLTSKGDSTNKKLETQLNLGNSYMDELDYEAAIAAYEEAIRIEPKSEEAYIGLANAYIEQGEYQKAIEVLDEGYAQTEAVAISDKRDEIVLILEEIEEAKRQAELAAQVTPTSVPKESEIEPYQETIHYGDGSYKIDEYDADWNIVKRSYYNADGTIDASIISECDIKERCVKDTHYNEDGTVDFYVVDEYDVNGNIVMGTWYYADGTINFGIEYNEYPEEDKTIYYNADGTVSSVREYDANGNKVKTTWYNADGTVYIVNEYDANGNIVKTTFYNADGTVSSVWEYDVNGNIINEIYY